MRLHIIQTVFFGLILFAFTETSVAQSYLGANTTSLGGAGRASVNPVDVGFINPAVLPQLRGYHIGFIYDTTTIGENPVSPTSGIVITDATEDTVFAASLSYLTQKLSIAGAEVHRDEYQLSTGFFLFERFSAGLYFKHARQLEANGDKHAQNNAGISFLYTPASYMGIALVFYDIMDTTEIPMNPTTAFGLNFIYPSILRIAADVAYPQKNNSQKMAIWSLGVESMFSAGFGLRLGHRWDNYASRRYGSAGLGWEGPKLCFDYAYEKDVELPIYRHSVDLRLQF